MKNLFSIGLCLLLAYPPMTAFGEALEAAPDVAIGHLLSVTGKVQGTSDDADPEPLAQGADLETDMLINTGEDGQAVLQFQDGQIIVLEENSSFQIHDYRYHPEDVKQSSLFFALHKGGLRAINGAIANQHPVAFRLETSPATVRLDHANFLGVRNADFMLEMRGRLYAKVNAGLLQMDNSAGAKTLVAGQAAVVATEKTLPVGLSDSELPPNLFTKLQAIAVPAANLANAKPDAAVTLEPVAQIYEMAGNVEIAIGDTEAERRTQKKKASKDMVVLNKSYIFVDAKSYALLKFNDGQVIGLKPNTTFQIKDYRYNPADPNKSLVDLNIIKGGLRAITGQIGHDRPAAFKLAAIGSTIKVRGTDFMLALDDPTYTQVLAGAISIANAAGSTVLNTEDTARIDSANALPVLIPASELPARVRDDFASLKRIPIPGQAAANPVANAPAAARPRPTAIDFCSNYGYAPGSDDYTQCLDYAKTEGYL